MALPSNPKDYSVVVEATSGREDRTSKLRWYADGYRATYEFNRQNRLVSTRDANGGFVTNTYDSVGRLSVVQNQLGESARQYGSDLAGRIVTMADAANRVRTYTFDAAGQDTALRLPDGTTTVDGVWFSNSAIIVTVIEGQKDEDVLLTKTILGTVRLSSRREAKALEQRLGIKVTVHKL